MFCDGLGLFLFYFVWCWLGVGYGKRSGDEGVVAVGSFCCKLVGKRGFRFLGFTLGFLGFSVMLAFIRF